MRANLAVLFVGQLWEGGTCQMRAEALCDLGCRVVRVDTCPPAVATKEHNILYRVRKRFIGPVDLAGANAAILAAVSQDDFDVLWIDKGLSIEAATLCEARRRRPALRIVGYSPDDVMNPSNRSRQFVEHLPFYDVFFTTKLSGVLDLHSLGCRRAERVGDAYHPGVHRPLDVPPCEKPILGGPVGFIGDWERERERSIVYVAERGVDVRVWGTNWRHASARSRHLRVEARALWSNDYARAICSFDINLAFLRKANRDVSTTRSVEIPACGGFMLAERTEEHLALFEEGKEAEFFGSNEELVEKVRYYLAHDQQRRHIAAAGYQRCLRSGYSNQERLNHMLGIVAGTVVPAEA